MTQDTNKYTKKLSAQDSIHYEKSEIKINVSKSEDIIFRKFLDDVDYQVADEFIFNYPGVESKIIYKFVLTNGASLTAIPKILVESGASGLNTHLSIKCLLLDSNSRALAIPSLEIKEDFVKAGHGASIGALDQFLIYSLQKQGISKADATKILIEAFLS